jgi:hypothetical protein
MQGFFFKSPFMTYTLNVGGSAIGVAPTELDLTNVTAGVNSTVKALESNITVSRGGASGKAALTASATAAAYAENANVAVTATNFAGTSSSVAGTANIAAIFDAPSATLVATLTGAIPSPNVSSVVGKQYVSGPASTFTFQSTLIPNPRLPSIANANAAIAAYDHAQVISTVDTNYDSDLQIVNGSFSSPGAGSGGYKNYGTYYYSTAGLNTVDYFGLTQAYRFATFGWNIPASANPYNTLNITLNGVANFTIASNMYSNSGGANNGGSFMTTSRPAPGTQDPLLIFYRYYDPATTQTSSWVCVNQPAEGATRPLVNNTNYRANLANLLYADINTAAVTSNNLVLGVSAPGAVIGSPITLFVRVGCAKESNFSFKSVSVYHGV